MGRPSLRFCRTTTTMATKLHYRRWPGHTDTDTDTDTYTYRETETRMCATKYAINSVLIYLHVIYAFWLLEHFIYVWKTRCSSSWDGLTLPLACPLYLHGSYVYLSIRKFHIVFGVYLLDVCCSVVVVRSAGVSGWKSWPRQDSKQLLLPGTGLLGLGQAAAARQHVKFIKHKQ